MIFNYCSILRPFVSPAHDPLGPGPPQADRREGPQLAHLRNGKLFQIVAPVLGVVVGVLGGVRVGARRQKGAQTVDLRQEQQLLEH